MSCADKLAVRQIELFDDVFLRLLDQVDTPSLAKLSSQISEAKVLPLNTARRLALEEDASIAGPILKSRAIPLKTLVEVTQTKSQTHLLAIAGRHSIDPSLGAILVQRGGLAVHCELARNLGARLPEASWSALAETAQQDHDLAGKLARHSDAPPHLKRKVLAKLDDVRMRSLQAMPYDMRGKIEATLATTDAAEKLHDPDPPDYIAAKAKVAELGRIGKLNDSTVNRFAINGEYSNLIAALSFLSGSSVEVIELLIVGDQIEELAVACKAARLNWATTTMIIRNRPGLPPISSDEFQKAKKTFEAFCLSAAQRTVRF